MNEQSKSTQEMVKKAHHDRPQPDMQHPGGPSQGMATERRGGAGNVPARRPASDLPSQQDLSQGTATGDLTTDRIAHVDSPLQQMYQLIAKSGEEGFSQHVIDVLSAPIVDGLVLVKPSGLIYVSHPHYRTRLDAAFGVGGWCLVPLDKPRIEGRRVIYYGFLKAGGRYIADALGGCDYIPQNQAMNLDDCVEGAKSDCLVRCCKVLPMFRECWDPEYIAYWKATYAHEVAAPGTRTGRAWRKKGEYMRNFNTKPNKESESEFRKTARVEDENMQHIESISHEKKYYRLTGGEELQGDEFYDDSRED